MATKSKVRREAIELADEIVEKQNRIINDLKLDYHTLKAAGCDPDGSIDTCLDIIRSAKEMKKTAIALEVD